MTWFTEWLKGALQEVQEYLRLVGKVFRGMVTRPFYLRDVIEQFDTIGVGSMTVVVLTGTFTGMVLTLQSGLTLDQFGARSMVGRLVSASMIKELGPVLTALMVCGRVGSGIAAELGSMNVTDQIAALRALGTDPVRKLVVPRGSRRWRPNRSSGWIRSSTGRWAPSKRPWAYSRNSDAPKGLQTAAMETTGCLSVRICGCPLHAVSRPAWLSPL